MFECNAPDLVKKWRSLVNDNVMMGRDAALIKKALTDGVTPAQILFGMYQYENEKTITIPQFLKQMEEWLLEPAGDAEIELACCMSHTIPPEYFLWQDYRETENSYGYKQSREAHRKIMQWAQKVLA